MSLNIRLLVAPLAVVLAVAPALAASAAPAIAASAAPTLNGRFVRVASESDNVNKAIDKAVAELNFVIRPIAHSRLEKTNVPYETIALAVGPKEVSITLDERAPLLTPASGTSVKWKREDGELFDVSTALKGNRLEQRFVAPDGSRLNSYTLDASGKKLTMAVTITSPKLPRPLTYEQVYQRAK